MFKDTTIHIQCNPLYIRSIYSKPGKKPIPQHLKENGSFYYLSSYTENTSYAFEN